MTIKEFLQWVIEHKDNSQVYSNVISTGALFFSVLSFTISQIVSKKRAKRDKIISDARYEEQRRQYEERLVEEKKQREDASGRKYKQTYCIDIVDRFGNANIINYAQPELCEK